MSAERSSQCEGHTLTRLLQQAEEPLPTASLMHGYGDLERMHAATLIEDNTQYTSFYPVSETMPLRRVSSPRVTRPRPSRRRPVRPDFDVDGRMT